jgi:cytidylate kinase
VTVITISRQYGSGGRTIAARICELEGYRFFDKQLIAQAAIEVGLGEEDVVDYPEFEFRTKRLHERLMDVVLGPGTVGKRTKATTPVLSWGGLEARLDEDWFVKLVNDTILDAYQQGNVVIVGRGGQALLQDKPDVLHVRLEAPLEERLRRLQEIENVSYGKARELAERHDKASTRYLQRFFSVRWDDPALYHLMLNTGKLQHATAAQIIIDAAQQFELQRVAG